MKWIVKQKLVIIPARNFDIQITEDDSADAHDQSELQHLPRLAVGIL